MNKFASKDHDLAFDDVLINPGISNISSRFDDNQCNPFYDKENKLLPIVSSPMDSIPSKEFIEKSKNKLYVTFSHRFQSFEDQLNQIKIGEGRVGGVIGMKSTNEEIEQMIACGVKHILLDIAHGANYHVRKKLEDLQPFRDKVKLWAGNVANVEGYNYIAFLADYIRCNVGSGSACTTRINTGCGRGAISSLIECRKAYEEYGHDKPAKIVADGGLRYNGDFGKALCAGAHIVMTGRTFAATYESAAPWVMPEGFQYDSKNMAINKDLVINQLVMPFVTTDCQKYISLTHKVYRGMASKIVNEESGKNMNKVSIEGASGQIKVNGPFDDVISQIEANLRSTMSYVGCNQVEDLYHNSQFVMSSQSTIVENNSHGV